MIVLVSLSLMKLLYEYFILITLLITAAVSVGDMIRAQIEPVDRVLLLG